MACLINEFSAFVLLLEAGKTKGLWMLNIPADHIKILEVVLFSTLNPGTLLNQLDGR
ncbi:MAG: hypothetical protein COC00_010910 [Rhizobiales bacterium]|nr:hypothetical protein [Hyphomicrobiales bacterium]